MTELAARIDLRPVVERLPWPDVRGLRCLDVGTRDFLAVELERRGAREVARARGPESLEQSVYDLDPSHGGTFELVTCGSLLLHLRDPVRGLEAIRSVCAGRLLSVEQLDLRLSALHPRRPVVRLGERELLEWWVPNAAAHRAMLETAGFAIERSARSLLRRMLAGGDGVPHQALLARPEPGG